MSLRVVCWNLNFWRQPSDKHRENAWTYLREELRADVALVQESGVPPVAEGHRVGTLIGGGRPWGTWVVGFTHQVRAVEQVKGAYSKSPVPLSFFTPGAAAVATVEGVDLTLASLYGLQNDGYAHPAVLRHLADLSLLLDDPKHVGRMVVGGDLNLTTQWVGPESAYRAIDGGVLAQFNTFGLTEVVAAHAPGPLEGCGCDDGDACCHQQTHWQTNSSRPWQDDYLWVSERLLSHVEVTVQTKGAVEQFSDHAPIVADIDY